MRGVTLILSLLLLSFKASALEVPPQLPALCYHDVVETLEEAQKDRMSVTVDTLVQHFSWLANNGYEPISLKQWQSADSLDDLPEKPILLSFDDGYASFRTRVLPLLEMFGFKAVLAPVTSWIDTPAGEKVQYGDELRDRSQFLTWEDIRVSLESDLVEVVSHTHDLHKGIIANPQGNIIPAAATSLYDSQAGYETNSQTIARITADLEKSRALLLLNLNTNVDAIAWPYGEYNSLSQEAARNAGLSTTLTLDDLPNEVGGKRIHRFLINHLTDLRRLHSFLTKSKRTPTIRAAHIDLDYVYDRDSEQMGRNIDALLDRIKAMQISAVFLQAFADSDGDGVAEGLYFPNRHLPVQQDLFSHLAWQLKTRAEVQVFAWMPVLAFKSENFTDAFQIVARDGSHKDHYYRLNPWEPDARQVIHDIYEDLGKHSRFDGVLFHDDAFITDRELNHLSAAEKTDGLISLTQELSDQLKGWQPDLLTSRNIYAEVVLNPTSEQWFAQNYDKFINTYDYTALMAMPYLEEARRPKKWLKELVTKIDQRSATAKDRTIFHLQTKDWRKDTTIRNRVLGQHFDLLLSRGVRHIAYYPDDFVQSHPSVKLVRKHLSTNWFPALKE